VGSTAPLALGLTWIHRESLPKAAYVNVFCLLYSYAYAMVTSAANKKTTLTAEQRLIEYDELIFIGKLENDSKLT